ncbi:transposase [Streptomyces lateritius]|uniref:Transposase n=1 Tax=Streptomyces lateritius TaxID=67313 RepID=A0ABW6YIK1_9ACTN
MDDRRVLNGIVWKVRTGTAWRDVADRYGPVGHAPHPFPQVGGGRHVRPDAAGRPGEGGRTDLPQACLNWPAASYGFAACKPHFQMISRWSSAPEGQHRGAGDFRPGASVAGLTAAARRPGRRATG